MISRFLAFLKRNRGAVGKQFFNQVLVRVWVSTRLWRFLRPFSRVRTPQTWVFMGGSYNSGTTIIREIIGSHPDVATLPREGVELTDAFPDLEKDGWVRMWHRNANESELKGRDLKQVALTAQKDWNFWWKRGAKVFLEKSIVHGSWMPALEQGFQNAHFIGVVRNGFCVCEGIRRRAEPTGIASEILGAGQYPIEEVGKQWAFANERLRRDRGTVSNYTEVYYEDFARNPIETMKSLFRFLGVRDDLVAMDNEGNVVIGKRKFTIRNQNQESYDRLSEMDREKLWGVIEPLMVEHGYSRSGVSRDG